MGFLPTTVKGTALVLLTCLVLAGGVAESRAQSAPRTASAEADPFFLQLSEAAIERTRHRVKYDPAYRVIPYPGGDVPDNRGVCTDVVIRSYRAVGIDLQRLVHEDMAAHFSAYPDNWGAARPDRNIDHRRVPNLQTFFTRMGGALPVTRNAADYLPGDLVTWMVDGRLPHIGIVVNRRTRDGREPMIVHNIGNGVELDGHMLFYYPITGHYRYRGRGAG